MKKPRKPRWGCAFFGDGDDTGVTGVTSRAQDRTAASIAATQAQSPLKRVRWHILCIQKLNSTRTPVPDKQCPPRVFIFSFRCSQPRSALGKDGKKS